MVQLFQTGGWWGKGERGTVIHCGKSIKSLEDEVACSSLHLSGKMKNCPKIYSVALEKYPLDIFSGKLVGWVQWRYKLAENLLSN